MIARIEVQDLTRRFGRRELFAGISFRVEHGQVCAITGRNGSGKSTLMKIIAGLLSPSAGSVEYHLDGHPLDPRTLHRHIGYAAPYLTLYEEFNALENLELYARIRGLPLERNRFHALLERSGLPLHRSDPIRSFSSGMKQRMKLLFALLHEPPFLFLDEPATNLDSDGVTLVHECMREQRQRGLVLLASNDPQDLAQADFSISVMNV